MDMKNKPRCKVSVLKAVISAAFFFVLFSFVKSHELISVFADIQWPFFILSFVLSLVMLMVSCMKWKVLLDTSGRRIDFFVLMRIYFVGYFFSNLLPSMVGGDLVRSYYGGRLIDNQAYSAASVFLERFTGMVFLLFLVVVAPLMHPVVYGNPFIYIPSLVALLLLVLLFSIWMIRGPLSLPDTVVRRCLAFLNQGATRTNMQLLQRLASGLEHLYSGLLKRLQKFKTELGTATAAIRKDRRMLLILVVLTVVFYVLTWVNVYVSFLAFGVHPGFIAISALVPTILFVGQIPLTLLGNLGFFESVFVLYFLLVQVSPAESLAMGLLLRVKMLWLGIIGYFVYLSLTRGKQSTFRRVEEVIDRKQ